MKKNNDKKIFVLLTFFFCLIIALMTFGFAFSDKILTIGGGITTRKVGKLKITDISVDSSGRNTLPANSGQGLYLDNNGNIALDYSFTVSSEQVTYYATYLVTLDNGSIDDYTFTGFNIAPEVTISGASDDEAGAFITHTFVTTTNSDLAIGDVIASDEVRKFAVELEIRVESSRPNTTIGVGGEATVGSEVYETGQFYGTLLTSSVDLKNQDLDCFDFEILNTYKSAKTFTVTSGNSNFQLVDSNENALSSFTIQAPDENDPESNVEQYNVCIKKSDGAIFTEDTTTASIIVEASGMNPTSIGTLNIAVPISQVQDTTPVSIGNVSFEKIQYDTSNNSLKTKVSWERLDSGGTDVDNYYIALFDSANTSTPLKTVELSGNTPTTGYEFVLDNAFLTENKSSLQNANKTFFVKVYGKDHAQNSGLEYCNSSNSYCVSSSAISLVYEYNLTLTSNNNNVALVVNGNKVTSTKIYYKAEFSSTITVTAKNYKLDGTITVSPTSGTYTNGTEYFFGLQSGSTTTANFTIYAGNIESNISVSTSTTADDQTCLVEGTMIRLADGTSKKIEDIRYEDLLIAISHQTGQVIEEYPIWIEQAGDIDEYQINTFSDGSVLKTVGTHGVYSADAKRYVSVKDRENFHVGTRVIKVNDNNEIEIVTVKKIEEIHSPVKYYHVSSTFYHNVIADNILTTDAILVVSNMFTFDDNLKWTSEREEFLAKGDVFHYEDWAHVFPEHIFKGFRMREAMILQHKGLLDISLFDRVLNRKIVMPPINNEGKLMWMVSTSDDLPGEYYVANSFYTLPEPKEVEGKTFKGWYNNGDDKIYMPGDQVEIIYSMHFVAMYE